MRIGIDFDNTIAGYDKVFRAVAWEMGFVAKDFTGAKTEVRDAIRRQDGGEEAWQRVQGRVYGKFMAEAKLMDGADRFLTACRDRGASVFIVSHKTEYGHHGPDRVNLREAARAWMSDRGFFRAEGFAVRPQDVFFEATRADKIARIRDLDCSHFIDDLEEVFLDHNFPKEVRCFLFGSGASAEAPLTAVAHWDDIREAIFGA